MPTQASSYYARLCSEKVGSLDILAFTGRVLHELLENIDPQQGMACVNRAYLDIEDDEQVRAAGIITVEGTSYELVEPEMRKLNEHICLRCAFGLSLGPNNPVCGIPTVYANLCLRATNPHEVWKEIKNV